MKQCKFGACDNGLTCCCCDCDSLLDRLGCVCTNVQEGADGTCEYLRKEEEKKMKYKVGDRVRIVDHMVPGMGAEMGHWLGKVMTIRHVDKSDGFYHMSEDNGAWLGNGWYWRGCMFAGLADGQEIHITVKGNTTHAVYKDGGKVIRHATAKCSPGDPFDFQTGVEIALFRLKYGVER